MLRFVKMLVLAFKPVSDEEAMQMNLNGPQAPKKRRECGAWEQIDERWKSLQIGPV